MLSQGRELAAIDFSNIIGGPLIAAIEAQENRHRSPSILFRKSLLNHNAQKTAQ